MTTPKRYKVIYADPPWSYGDKLGNSSHFGAATSAYPTQPLAWIKSLPVADLADRDCALLLWATSPLLPQALEVIAAWGFKYKTLGFCWLKEYDRPGTLVKNLGRYTMGGVELCLLATKGSPQRVVKNMRQVHYEMRGAHSQKPAAIRDKIVTLFGDVPRVELFARQKVQGWDAWGNEVESDINLTV